MKIISYYKRPLLREVHQHFSNLCPTLGEGHHLYSIENKPQLTTFMIQYAEIYFYGQHNFVESRMNYGIVIWKKIL